MNEVFSEIVDLQSKLEKLAAPTLFEGVKQLARNHKWRAVSMRIGDLQSLLRVAEIQAQDIVATAYDELYSGEVLGHESANCERFGDDEDGDHKPYRGSSYRWPGDGSNKRSLALSGGMYDHCARAER